MPIREVAFLGPVGTFSHLVAEKRFGSRRCEMVSMPTIPDVCTFVGRNRSRRGIIPIENSSGGAIYETVDILLNDQPHVNVQEELSLNVTLALLGRRGEKIRHLYSHFAPLEHCTTWLRRKHPHVEKHVVASTAVAAYQASQQPGAAALGNRRLAGIYQLKVLEYPVQADLPNLTVFLVVGGERVMHRDADVTTLAVMLPNVPGSLCTFLEAFRNENVNLSRLISRPMRGCPRQYAFLVDVQGAVGSDPVRRALARARKTSVEVRVVGSYPCRKPYSS